MQRNKKVGPIHRKARNLLIEIEESLDVGLTKQILQSTVLKKAQRAQGNYVERTTGN